MKNDKGNKFGKYAVTVLAIVITLSVCLCTLLFLTNGVVEVDIDNMIEAPTFERTTVVTVVEDATPKKDKPKLPGIPEEPDPEPRKPMVVFGDSISTFDGVTTFNQMYPYGDVQSVDDTWWKIVQTAWQQQDLVNDSSSGSCVTDNKQYPANSQERLEALPDSASTVIVFMGMNDYWDGYTISAFKDAYTKLLDNIKIKCSPDKILCCTLWKTGFEDSSHKVADYNDVIQECASASGASVADLSVLDMCTAAMTVESDVHVHPTKAGMKAIADVILGQYTPPAPQPTPNPEPEPEPEPEPNPPNPVKGDTLTFPAVGESVHYRVINTNAEGNAPRITPDTLAWEFALGYISTTTDSQWKTMKARANTIKPYATNANTNDALKVKLGGSEYYVGCLPIPGFGQLGDIVEFTFDDGSTMQMLAIDAMSDHDSSGATNQCNTAYCHAMLDNGGLSLNALELWCAGSATKKGNFDSIPKGYAVKAQIVGHWDGF